MPRQFCLSVCPSVRPSVTWVYCTKTAKRIIEIISLSDRLINQIKITQNLPYVKHQLAWSSSLTVVYNVEYKHAQIANTIGYRHTLNCSQLLFNGITRFGDADNVFEKTAACSRH